MRSEITVQKYDANYEKIWDEFVLKESVNGTFLQTRSFLNYHPENRFKDASYIMFDLKGHIIAVCPACMLEENGEKTFYSHMGSTYGGLVIAQKKYNAESVIAIINALENRAIEDGYNKIVLKPTSDLFARREGALVEYCLYYKKYRSYDELNLYMDLDCISDNILSLFAQGKRTNVHNCEKAGLIVRQIENKQEISDFYNILCETLEKYHRKPVHTYEELVLLKEHILKDKMGFFGCFMDGEMIAGSMMFYFENVMNAHTQYLCAKHKYDKLSPMTYMYYAMIVEMKKRGYHKLCWGITTEHLGNELNMGLTRSKEAYGSKYSLLRTFEKTLMGE